MTVKEKRDWKVAVTDRAALKVTVQVFSVPVHAPDQPVNALPGSAVAESVTDSPEVKGAWQVDPQSMPAGFEVTIPAPVPPFETVSVTSGVKVADTERDAAIVTVQLISAPEHDPAQPTNVLPRDGLAVRVIDVPDMNEPLHADPQLIPDGIEEIVPAPDFVTVSVYGTCWNVAVTDRLVDMESMHVGLVPLHAPDHPLNR